MSDDNELPEAQGVANGNGLYLTPEERATLIELVRTIADEQLRQNEQIAALRGAHTETRDVLAGMRAELKRIAKAVGA
jgi:hypothetical protein